MPDGVEVGGIAADRLKSFIERIENLEGEIKDLNSDKSEVFKEAKGSGFDLPALREVIKRRRMQPDQRDELDHLVDLYERAAGDRLPLPEPVAPRHTEAHDAGYADGLAGDERPNATRWPSGEYGHGDYEIGFERGRTERIDRDEADRLPPAASRARARAHARAEA